MARQMVGEAFHSGVRDLPAKDAGIECIGIGEVAADDGTGELHAVPVDVDASAPVGIVGPREAALALARALVVQTAVVNFAEWMRNPDGDVGYTAQAFEVVPQDLRRRIALRQSVEMVRVTMEFFEEVVPLLALK